MKPESVQVIGALLDTVRYLALLGLWAYGIRQVLNYLTTIGWKIPRQNLPPETGWLMSPAPRPGATETAPPLDGIDRTTPTEPDIRRPNPIH